jgi:hypothetical protein
MDANDFDRLSRSLIIPPSRRSVLGLAFGGGLGALLPLVGIEAKSKKKKRKKCKGGSGDCPDGTKNCSGACVPLDACCPACTTGRTCLSNGSCGRACSSVPEVSCPDACGDCLGGVEGEAYCVAPGSCEIVGPDCETTADCPYGYHCQMNSCPPGVATRCLPLCES